MTGFEFGFCTFTMNYSWSIHCNSRRLEQIDNYWRDRKSYKSLLKQTQWWQWRWLIFKQVVTLFLYDLSVSISGDCLSPPPGGEPPSNGQPFTTHDQDNDAEPDLNCADELKGGWWFNRCTLSADSWGVGPHSNLNGEYSQIPPVDEYGRGIVWNFIYQQITRTEMKMRRAWKT